MTEQNLYRIFKLPSSMLVANNLIISGYTVAKGMKEGNVVSIGDNLVFREIRLLRGDTRSDHDIFAHVDHVRRNQKIYRQHGEWKKARILESVINSELFVKDIVNVVIDGRKSDFHKFRVKGFSLNGVHYTYLCSGSGQIRRNTATFVCDELRDELVHRLNCGLDEKTSEFKLAKYTAYFALAFSSVLWVRTPRVCVIKDFFRTLKDQPVDFIVRNAADGKDASATLERRTMDIELNCADGQGLIDPSFAALWAQDMGLDYTPVSFVARSCFVKGQLVSFDFKAYAKEHGITTIRDRWGKEYPIDEIDVLLSESQFKTNAYYDSWQEYMSYAERGNICWGVARYTKKHDAAMTLANYQYIQSLTLTPEDVKGLVKPTADWIAKVCSGDPFYSMLFMFGAKDEDAGFRALYGSAQSPALKAVAKDSRFLNDSFVKGRMRKAIRECIKRAKLGQIWVRGNYQFCISDPVAQCQSALGLDPVGVVGQNQVYSAYWEQRNVIKIDICRSPMIDVHEHNPSEVLFGNREADRWLSHLYSGIVFSTYDTATARMEDSDFDGDIVLSTDNEYFIKGANKDHPIITYEKGAPKPEKMTVANITKTAYKGFGSGVGGFSNTATVLYSMAAVFRPDDPRRAEIMRRIKLLREIVGQEIDRIKGADKPHLPAEWRRIEKILPEDSETEKTRKYYMNSMAITKKPYFFRYRYPDLDRRFRQFESSYDRVSRDMFGIPLKKLMKKPASERTKDEENLLRRYRKYSPLVTSSCSMNLLCREMEHVDDDIRFGRDAATGRKEENISMLPTYAGYCASDHDPARMDAVVKSYRQYKARRRVKALDAVLDGFPEDPGSESFPAISRSMDDALVDAIRDGLADIGMDGEEFLYYCSRIAPTYKSFDWGFAWAVLGDSIVRYIPYGESFMPVRDPDGPVEYLGEHYSMVSVTQHRELATQQLFGSLFGDPEGNGDSAMEIRDIRDAHDVPEEDAADEEAALTTHDEQ